MQTCKQGAGNMTLNNILILITQNFFKNLTQEW